MLPIALILAQLANPAQASTLESTTRPDIAASLPLACDGCKTADNLVLSSRPEERRGQLAVYLVGTQNDAAQFGHMVDAAATAGLDALAVGWSNGQTALDHCFDMADPAEGNTCYAEYQTHIRLGEDAMPDDGWVWTADLLVPTEDSVEYRIRELVTRMARSDDAWGSYLTDDGTIAWNQVVVSGFSQGASHARSLAMAHQTAGLLMVDGGGVAYSLEADTDGALCAPHDGAFACAPELDEPSTPTDRWYGIYDATRPAHEVDLYTLLWASWGLSATDRFGDEAEGPRTGGQVFYTTQCDGIGPLSHLSLSVDGWMPLDRSCSTVASYPEDAGRFPMFPAYVDLFRAAASTAPAAPLGPLVETGPEDRPQVRQPAPDTDLEPTVGGCDNTGGGAPVAAFLAPLALLGLRRKSR